MQGCDVQQVWCQVKNCHSKDTSGQKFKFKLTSFIPLGRGRGCEWAENKNTVNEADENKFWRLSWSNYIFRKARKEWWEWKRNTDIYGGGGVGGCSLWRAWSGALSIQCQTWVRFPPSALSTLLLLSPRLASLLRGTDGTGFIVRTGAGVSLVPKSL